MSFYDCKEPFSHPDVADLDRVYQFYWHEFTQEHWDSLATNYESLPGWGGYEPVPWWFGNDERTCPHLTASVEPPGLQVCGVLPIEDFMTWHDAFMEAIRNFPAYKCD